MKTKDILLYALAGVITTGYFTFLFMLNYVTIPENNRDMMNQAAGALLMAFATIVGFFFGSSMGSKEKDIAKTETAPVVVETKAIETTDKPLNS